MTKYLTIAYNGSAPEIWSGIESAESSGYRPGIMFVVGEFTKLEQTLRQVEDVIGDQRPVGWTTQNEAIIAITSEQEAILIQASTKALEARESRLQAEIDAANRSVAPVINGSRTFPGLRGFEEGEV